MKCPKCDKEMKRGTTCESCSHCGGNWFTIEEARRYLEIEAAEQELGSESYLSFEMKETKYPCPSCKAPLTQIRVKKELILDQCVRCNGFFFDPGESLKLKNRLSLGHGGPAFQKLVQSIFCS
jgi:Zn-finger nucleic acid-binding protein